MFTVYKKKPSQQTTVYPEIYWNEVLEVQG